MIVLPSLLKYHKKLKESEVVTANSSCYGNVISHYSSLNSSKKLFSCFRMTLHFALLHPCFIACVIALLQMNAVEAKIHVYNQDGEKVQSFFDREWEYGGMLVEPIQGFIVMAEPPDACTKVAEPTFLSNFTVGKFILIKGNENCSNILKVRNAERAGYDVAVIFDPDPLPLQFVRTVPFPGSENKIPAIFIAYEDGVVIRENYQFNNSFLNNYILEITPNSQDMSYYLMLFALVIGVCFIIMLLFMICLLIKCIQERRKRRRNRLSTRQIKQVPTAKFSKGDQYDVCAICLEDYNEGDKLRILPCEHAYHAKCVDPWLMNNRRNCPLCKRKITFGDSPAGSDSEDSELASPAENTPLIGTPVHYGPPTSWGTFTTPTNHPVTPLTNLGFDGLETQQPNTSQANSQRVMATIESSDEELIACLAPSDCSVNNSRDNSPVANSEEEAMVHVSYVTVADSNGCASSGQHGFIV